MLCLCGNIKSFFNDFYIKFKNQTCGKLSVKLQTMRCIKRKLCLFNARGRSFFLYETNKRYEVHWATILIEKQNFSFEASLAKKKGKKLSLYIDTKNLFKNISQFWRSWKLFNASKYFQRIFNFDFSCKTILMHKIADHDDDDDVILLFIA